MFSDPKKKKLSLRFLSLHLTAIHPLNCSCKTNHPITITGRRCAILHYFTFLILLRYTANTGGLHLQICQALSVPHWRHRQQSIWRCFLSVHCMLYPLILQLSLKCAIKIAQTKRFIAAYRDALFLLRRSANITE